MFFTWKTVLANAVAVIVFGTILILCLLGVKYLLTM